MSGLQIVNLEQTDITAWNFEEIKKSLVSALSVYQTTVYTDENIKLAKDDKAKLGKLKTMIEDQRKAYKAKCMAPYEELEPKVKDIVSIIEEQRTEIDKVVKEYTERQRAEKEKEVRTYYDKKAHVLGELAAPLYEKLLDSKWLTASSGKKYQEEIQIKINEALEAINTLKDMNSPFIDTVLEKYVATLSLEEAKAKHEELVAAANKAGLGQQGTQAANQEPKSEKVTDSEGILVKMYGNNNQITQVMDFAKALGVKLEIV